MKAAFLLSFLAASTALGLMAQRPKPPEYYTPDSKDEGLKCVCLSLHPDFCSTEGPIPSCCRAAESGTKAKDCRCCKSGKPADPKIRGTYTHERM